MVTTVPPINGLAGYVVEHPALARLHAKGMDLIAKQIVVVAHDDTIERHR